MNKLKPCPFCEVSQVGILDPVDLAGRDRWQIACGRCGSHSGICKTRPEAIRLWNNRPGDRRLLNQIEIEARQVLCGGTFRADFGLPAMRVLGKVIEKIKDKI